MLPKINMNVQHESVNRHNELPHHAENEYQRAQCQRYEALKHDNDIVLEKGEVYKKLYEYNFEIKGEEIQI